MVIDVDDPHLGLYATEKELQSVFLIIDVLVLQLCKLIFPSVGLINLLRLLL